MQQLVRFEIVTSSPCKTQPDHALPAGLLALPGWLLTAGLSILFAAISSGLPSVYPGCGYGRYAGKRAAACWKTEPLPYSLLSTTLSTHV